MTGFWDFLAGSLTGALSALGIGGGSLLLLYLTGLRGWEQTAAQGVNLLYFLPAAGSALPAHLKNRLVARPLLPFAIPGGLLGAGAGALLSHWVGENLLRRGFGLLLLCAAARELFLLLSPKSPP